MTLPHTSESPACGRAVFWWAGEYEGECKLPAGHDGPHFDGLHWFNDEGDEVPPPEDNDD